MTDSSRHKMRLIDEQSFQFSLRSSKNASIFTLSNLVDSESLLTSDNGRWQIDHLQRLREQLNKCKAQVGTFPLSEWDVHTEKTEISSNIKRVIRNRFTIKPPIMTRAWIKFYDIMGTFPLFGSTDDISIRSLFLCEAPGAFVNATNHFVRSNFCNINFEWIATTLNPYYEQIDFDAFVVDDQFINDPHCFRNWFFASHNTGDMLDENFSKDLRDYVCNTFKSNDSNLFDCVSGDGAFNCLNDPERQEEMVFKLIFKEIMVATQFIKNGGSMVIKFFTAFSRETISLLYFVCNVFHEVTCYKPVASKHGNSEMYLVCLKFNRNVYHSLIPRLNHLTAEFIFSRQTIGEEFISQVSELCKQMAERQMKAIDANVKLFNKFSSDQMKAITREKYIVGEQFIQKFNLFSIPLSDQLVFGDRYRRPFSKRFFSLFNNYQHHKSASIFCNQLACVISELELDSSPQVVVNRKRNHFKLTPSYGKSFEHINNSKFCCLYVLRFLIIANSHISFTSSVTHTELFISVLSSVIKEDFPVIFYQKTSFSELFEHHWAKQHSSGVYFRALTQNDSSTITQNSTEIHIFDLYDSTLSITSNDFKLCTTLRDNFCSLLQNQHLKLNHSLIIRFKILLSRLSVSLIYVLSKAFRKLTIFPHYTPADAVHPSIILVMSDYCHLPPHLMCLFSGDTSEQITWTDKLLELVPVPDIVADQGFYDALFNANCVAILECIKQTLVDCGTGEEENNNNIVCKEDSINVN